MYTYVYCHHKKGKIKTALGTNPSAAILLCQAKNNQILAISKWNFTTNENIFYKLAHIWIQIIRIIGFSDTCFWKM